MQVILLYDLPFTPSPYCELCDRVYFKSYLNQSRLLLWLWRLAYLKHFTVCLYAAVCSKATYQSIWRTWKRQYLVSSY